jgi:sporulation protein YlmC with PRC-barrel domain
MAEQHNRFGERYDAVLHLLDRQVIGSDGLFVCKVDDIELTEDAGGLTATALLAGPAALLPRLAGPLGLTARRLWAHMGDAQADRRLPYRIGFELVEKLTSAVTLRRPRHGVLVRAPGEPTDDPVRRRLGQLLRMRVDAPEGRRRVLDVRVDEDQRVRSLVIGPGRPGSMLGYDRRQGRPHEQGPALVRILVQRLHRHAREVPFDQVRIDWDQDVVTVAGQARDG